MGATSHPANLAIIETIVNLAHNLGMKTVAEWVEDEATFEALLEIGVDYVQGYLIAPSMPPDELLKCSHAASRISSKKLSERVQQLNKIAQGARPVATLMH
jgi:EAL domain-containing protein (putative c-di-GMP-specific phosphodiesterase class I)